MDKRIKGKLKLNGKEYNCEIRDGVRYVNGMNPDEFVDYLADNGDWTALHDLVIIGMQVVKDTKKNTTSSYQKLANELYLKKVN
jgi:hypothetical protein